jgi:xylulokinase
MTFIAWEWTDPMNYMGVDVGTSGCKAVVFDEKGVQQASSYREYNVIFTEDGGAELSPGEVMQECEAVIREAGSQAGLRSIRGLGISSQGEAFTALGHDGKTLCNAMISSDIRAIQQAKTWPERFGEETLYRITGHTAHPLFTLFKLLWIKEMRPDVWENGAKFLCFEDLLHERLGLDPAISWSLAGRTMLFDVRKHAWSDEILGGIGLDAGKLARPMPSGSIVGVVPEKVADRLGLAEGAFVVTGGHDQPCGALGAGVTDPGSAMYGTGTVECITPAFSDPVFTEEMRRNNICTFDHTVPGMYTSLAYSLTGGNILKWFRDEFGAKEVEEAGKTGRNAYALLLATMDDRPSELMVLPYFTPSGTPYFDTTTRGAILGLRITTKRKDIIKALIEGVLYEMKLNLHILERSGCTIHELRAIGGGAKSKCWNQLKADVLSKPVIALNVVEAGCMGAAMLACAADGGRDLRGMAKEWVKPLERYLPRPEQAEHYTRQFERYKRMYRALKELDRTDQDYPPPTS